MKTALDIIVIYEELSRKLSSVSQALGCGGRNIDKEKMANLKKDGRYFVQLLVSDYERLTKQVEDLKGTTIKVEGQLAEWDNN